TNIAKPASDFPFLRMTQRQMSARCGCSSKAKRDVCLDVLDIFQADLQTNHRSAIFALGDRAVAQLDVDSKAFESTPGISKAEDFQRIEKSVSLFCPATIEDDGENAA